MVIFNPWSLEQLLQASHPGKAISGTINARNSKYQVQVKTSRRPEQGDFTYINAEIDMRRARENMFSAQQVYALASRYGGDESLRIMLNNDFDKFPYRFFDISIDGGEIRSSENFRTLHMPAGEFTTRPLLRDICRILHLCYEERKDSFYLPREQQLVLTPDTIKEVYQRMQKSGYFPSLSCSSPHKGFSMFQRPAPQGIDQTLNIHLGQQFSGGNPLTRKKISLLQETLLEYCPALPKLDYAWRTETAKDLEGWEGTSMCP